MAAAHDLFIGFDSAWTDKAAAPGAICALEVDSTGAGVFHEPRLASFADALAFVHDLHDPDGFALVALDQPTIVPNLSGKRPVERAVSSLVGWLGGGVQPSNRGKRGMFCDASPIWPFLDRLAARQAPAEAREADAGLYLIEVFPALALPSIEPRFFGRLAAPKYNPARRTFRIEHWRAVAEAAADAFASLDFGEPGNWCRRVAAIERPSKSDQDRLDAMLCLLVALRWRRSPRRASLVLGSLDDGYMVAPASPAVRERLVRAARERRVAVDAC